MDPIAHTLVGASLAKTRLKTLTPLATTILVLAANAPDIDVISMFGGRDVSLGFRRGWTHGLLAMIVLPLILAGLVMIADRLLAKMRNVPCRARARPVIALSYIGVITHPLLDWLNTYGVRLLMPFDNRWFYGDALFIVDPWVWLLGGTVVVLLTTKKNTNQKPERKISIRHLWTTLGILLTALVISFPSVPTLARAVWLLGVLAIGATCFYGRVPSRGTRLAVSCLVAIGLYAMAMATGSKLAVQQTNEWLKEHGRVGFAAMAGPLPGNPFVRDIIVTDDDHYHFLEFHWFGKERFRVAAPSVNRGQVTPVVEAALTAPHIKGLLTWIRFPSYAVEIVPDGYRVTLGDVRYHRLGGSGLGVSIVNVDEDFRVRGLD